MRRPLADKRPIGPVAQLSGKSPFLRIVTNKDIDQSDMLADIEDIVGFDKADAIRRGLSISDRSSGGKDVHIPLGPLNLNNLVDMEDIIEDVKGEDGKAFFECKTVSEPIV